MSRQASQPKQRSDDAIKKQKYIGSIHRRIITIPWILMKSFGYRIKINKDKRKSEIIFPCYLVSKIVSKEGITVFDSKELSKEFQKETNHGEKTQVETNWIKKKLNNKLIDILESLGFFVKTKSSNKVKNGLINHLKKFFNDNKDVKRALFYLNDENVIVSKFKRSKQVISLFTDISPIEQLLSIQSTSFNENLSHSNECSERPSYVNETTEALEQEQSGIRTVAQINSMNVVDEFSKLNQLNQLSETYQQPSNDFPFCYCSNGTVYGLIPISYNSNTPNGFYSFEVVEYEQQPINFLEGNYFDEGNCFGEGLMRLNVYQQQNLGLNYQF
ncbi:hypothetical protein QTN25_005610 [Entamoeba marina]